LKIRPTLIFTFIIGLTLTPLAVAQGPGSNLEKGIWHYKHENYEEGLQSLKEARQEDPNSSLAAYYLGLTYKRLQDYEAARPHLEASVSLRPKIKGALIELIDLLYRLGDTEEAKKWIDVSEKEGIRPGQTAFLKGLTLLREGEDLDEAIETLQEARELNDSLAQVVDYHIGIAHLKSKRLSDAKEVFADIAEQDSSGDLGQFAEEYLKIIENKLYQTRPLKLMISSYYQYDDNVILKPDTGLEDVDIADEEDHRMVYAGSAEYDLRLSEQIGTKFGYSFYLGDQFDLDAYDVFSNNYSLQPTLYFDKTVVAFPVLFNHLIVDDDDYLYSISTGNLTNTMIGQRHMLQGAFSYRHKDYQRHLSSFDENRDAHEYRGHLAHYYFYTKNKKGFVNAKVSSNLNDAKGNNWEYVENKVTLNSVVPLHEKIKLSVTGSFNLKNFLEKHTVFDKHRTDTTYQVSSLFAVEILNGAEVQFQYTYVNNGSDIELYDYTRNIYSAGVKYKF